MTLSARKREILRWMAMGKSNAEIADILDVATGTVKNHAAQLARHYGVYGTNARLMVVVAGIVHGDIDPRDLRMRRSRARS